MSFPNTRHPPPPHHHSRWRWAEEAAMRSSSVILFDSTVVHGLGFTHSLAGDFEGGSLVGCDTLRICAQIRLDLLPHLLLGVQLFVWFTCAKANRTNPKLRFTTIIYDLLCFINFQGRNALTTYVLLYVHIVAQSHGLLFCVFVSSMYPSMQAIPSAQVESRKTLCANEQRLSSHDCVRSFILIIREDKQH